MRRGVVPAEIAATRDLRALINWPGLLELLEEEGVESVPTDGVRYWLARLGSGFQAHLASAGVLCSETSVHHIIARSNRGIDHPLNFFLLDRGDNSALGSQVEGFRGKGARRQRGPTWGAGAGWAGDREGVWAARGFPAAS